MEHPVLKILQKNLCDVAHENFQGRVSLGQPARDDAGTGPSYTPR